MKKEFLDFINQLMNANPDLTNKLMTEDIEAYLKILAEVKDDKPVLSENGKIILEFLQEHLDNRLWKSKDIAEQIGLGSRSVSGAMRKLCNDGFCEKIGKDPCIFALTEKGKTFVIEKD